MPTYRPLRIKTSRFGLNTHARPEDLAPGEATVAANVTFSRGTIRKRSGQRSLLTGGLDSVLKGGVPAQSLYVVGEEWWLEHDKSITDSRANTTVTANEWDRRDFYHHRQGCIIIPEDDLTGMRLDVQAGDVNWAIEFPIWTDTLPLHKYQPLGNSYPYNIIVAAKSQNTSSSTNTSSQWAVRMIPDATSTERFHIVLTLYEGASHAAGTDFYYQSGAARAWAEPGRRIWVAWKFDQAAATITSYYWIEGATSVVSSSQSVVGTLRTNGVGGGAYPICIGRRPMNNNSNTFREMGFNGVVADLRFWDNSGGGSLTLPANFGTVTASPPATTDWYVEREITDEQLTTDSGVESGNIAQTTSLRAYWQFKPELLGTDSAGTEVSAEKYRHLRPRYRSSGATTPLAWVTGADATWADGGGALGTYSLALTPAGPTGQKYAFGDVLHAITTSGSLYGHRTYRCGIRVPNGSAYLNRVTASGSSGAEWPESFSVLASVKVEALPSSTSYDEAIFEIAVVRQGTAPNYWNYAVVPTIRLAIVNSGGSWKFQWRVLDGAGAATNIVSTTVVAEGSTYTVAGTARWWQSTDRRLALYVNGAQESNSNAAGSKPWVSQVTRSDATSPNEDDEDGRDICFPISVGYTNSTVEAEINIPPDPWSFRFGANGPNVLYNNLPVTHGYWARHENRTKKDANSGVPYRGNSPFVGKIGGLHIWRNHELNESEARRYADRGPNAQERAAYGSRLASSWDMEEGQGTIVYDKGYLKNHLPINPFPTVKVQTGAFDRNKRGPLLGLVQRRERQVRSGIPVREVYAIGGGVVSKLTSDGTNDYLAPIGQIQTPQLYDQTNKALDLPTTFTFNDQVYICTGLGPVKRITNGKLLDAGLNPVYGDPGQDQTNLGWREFDRDGTFAIKAQDANPPGVPENFIEDPPNGVIGYMVTHYDPESGIESAPSRAMYTTVSNFGTSAGNGWYGIQLVGLPKSSQKNVTKYRIYRTQKDGSEFRFLDEIDVAYSWWDTNADTLLGSAIDSQLNYPPPQNARLGIAFGARAIYAGVKETPNTVYYSLLGQPGAVPPQYQLTFPEQITALLPLNDRVLVGTTNRWYALFDTGGDISITSFDAPPIQYVVVTEETGCLGHHSCVMVPGVGWIFAGEKGLYATNGQNFRYLSEPIEPDWSSLNLNAGSRFVGVLHQRDNQYILFHSNIGDPDSRNSRAIVFQYDTRAFSLFNSMYVLSAATIEDEDTGLDRIALTDYMGNIWEYDPPDVTVNADGVTAAPYTGSVVSAKKDPLGTGKYTRIQLSSTNQLPTAGSGLRGVNLYIANGATPWNTVTCRIFWNDANWVWIESTNATTSDPTGFSWKLGAFLGRWVSGKMDLGAPSFLKKTFRSQVEWGAVGGTTAGFSFQWDEQAAQTFTTLSPARRFDTIAPILGRGRNCQIAIYDSTATGGETNNPWEVREIEWDFFPKGRATYVGA